MSLSVGWQSEPNMSTDALEPEIIDVATATTAVIRGVVDMGALADFFDRSFSTLAAALADQGIAPMSPAFARYHGPPTATADLEVGFVTDRPVQPHGPVTVSTLGGGRVARVIHSGGYDQLGSSWGRLRSWIEDRGLVPGADLWEVYVTEPSPDMDPADLTTELNWSLA
jgi:effector-binding domain-containing protein